MEGSFDARLSTCLLSHFTFMYYSGCSRPSSLQSHRRRSRFKNRGSPSLETFTGSSLLHYIHSSMRSSTLLVGAFAVAVAASPHPMPAPQAGGAGCKKVVLIFARGSTETGTMGMYTVHTLLLPLIHRPNRIFHDSYFNSKMKNQTKTN
jgi:hypothetical protein